MIKRRISLSLIGLYFSLFNAFSQTNNDSLYQPKDLKYEETNFVSSYYNQNGNHSAVRGGIGDEHVMDLSNGLNLKYVGSDIYNNKQELTVGLGVDYHTAASAAWVSQTGASKKGGERVYPSIEWFEENQANKSNYSLGAYYSAEYNYHSFGLDASYSKKTNTNGQFDGKVSLYLDKVKLIYPSELIPIQPTVITSASGGGGSSNTPSSGRNTLSITGSFSQVINSRLQASVTMDLVEQNGYLGLPFHRVFFKDGSEKVENLPSNRFKFPLGFRMNYFAGDKTIIRSYYRFYVDEWGVVAHTADLEIPFKVTPFFSISPFYRYYTQTAAYYFAPYKQHDISVNYYTSNYALSAFSSQYVGMGIRIAPPNGILNSRLSSLEIRFGHYLQTTDLESNILSTAWQFK